MPYYQTGDTSGSIQAPIVLDTVSISGAVFLGNIAMQLTATQFADQYGSGSTFPPLSMSMHYWNNGTQSWDKVSGSDGALYLTSSVGRPIWVTGVMSIEPDLTTEHSTTYMYACSTSSALFLTGSELRRQVSIYNGAISQLFISFGTTASTSSYVCQLKPHSFFELSTANGIYVGPIAGVWEEPSTGAAAVTEIWK